MAILSREAVLKAQDIKTEDVPIPEWGGSIRVRQMTVAERGEFSRRASAENKGSVGAWLLSILAVDESGSPLFKPEDAAELEKRNFKAVDAAVDAILRLNRVDEKAVEAAEKNS